MNKRKQNDSTNKKTEKQRQIRSQLECIKESTFIYCEKCKKIEEYWTEMIKHSIDILVCQTSYMYPLDEEVVAINGFRCHNNFEEEEHTIPNEFDEGCQDNIYIEQEEPNQIDDVQVDYYEELHEKLHEGQHLNLYNTSKLIHFRFNKSLNSVYVDGENGLKLFIQCINNERNIKIKSISFSNIFTIRQTQNNNNIYDIIEHIKQNKDLESLFFNDFDIYHPTTKHLIQAISTNSSIKCINLESSNHLLLRYLTGETKPIFVTLEDIPKMLSNIEHLSMSGLGCYDFHHIYDLYSSIASNNTIKIMKLKNLTLGIPSEENVLTMKNISRLIGNIIGGKQLISLDISNCFGFNSFLDSLFEKIYSNKTLKSIKIKRIVYHNNLDNLGFNNVIESTNNLIKNNRVLEHIEIDGQYSGTHEINLDFLKLNTTLKTLSILMPGNASHPVHKPNFLKSIYSFLLENKTLDYLFLFPYQNKHFHNLLHCNLIWSPTLHHYTPKRFNSAVLTFLLCHNFIRLKTKIRIPKFVLFEIIKFIDRKPFLTLSSSSKDKKNSTSKRIKK
jgi:hypothetical protein